MKKNRIFAIVALLAVIVSSVVVFQACRKKIVEKNYRNNENVISASSTSDIEEYLLNLRKRMKTAAKDGETISLSDAEWCLSALENFGFCDGSKRSDEMIVDTFYTTINVINNNVTLYDLNLVYENNKKDILNKFNSLSSDDKNIYLINCHIDTLAKEGTTRVTTVTSMRNGGSTIGNPMRFGPTDYWYDFDLRGKCGPYEGQCVGRDATTEMRLKVMANIGSYACIHGRIFYSNISEAYAGPYEFSQILGDCDDSPYPPDCIYTNYESSYRCVTPEELNWYLDRILFFLDVFNEDGSSLINVDVERGYWVGDALSGNSFMFLDLTYADVNCTQTPMDI